MARTTPYVGGDKRSRAGGEPSSAMERALGTASETAGKVAGAVEYGADAVADAAETARKTANDLSATVRTSLKEQPMTTLLIAAAIGFVIGAIWKD